MALIESFITGDEILPLSHERSISHEGFEKIVSITSREEISLAWSGIMDQYKKGDLDSKSIFSLGLLLTAQKNDIVRNYADRDSLHAVLDNWYEFIDLENSSEFQKAQYNGGKVSDGWDFKIKRILSKKEETTEIFSYQKVLPLLTSNLSIPNPIDEYLANNFVDWKYFPDFSFDLNEISKTHIHPLLLSIPWGIKLADQGIAHMIKTLDNLLSIKGDHTIFHLRDTNEDFASMNKLYSLYHGEYNQSPSIAFGLGYNHKLREEITRLCKESYGEGYYENAKKLWEIISHMNISSLHTDERDAYLFEPKQQINWIRSLRREITHLLLQPTDLNTKFLDELIKAVQTDPTFPNKFQENTLDTLTNLKNDYGQIHCVEQAWQIFDILYPSISFVDSKIRNPLWRIFNVRYHKSILKNLDFDVSHIKNMKSTSTNINPWSYVQFSENINQQVSETSINVITYDEIVDQNPLPDNYIDTIPEDLEIHKKEYVETEPQLSPEELAKRRLSSIMQVLSIRYPEADILTIMTMAERQVYIEERRARNEKKKNKRKK